MGDVSSSGPSGLHLPLSSIQGIASVTSRRPHVTLVDTGQSPKSPLYLLQKSILLSPCITAPSSLWSFLRPLSLNKQQHLISVSEERLSPIVLYSKYSRLSTVQYSTVQYSTV